MHIKTKSLPRVRGGNGYINKVQKKVSGGYDRHLHVENKVTDQGVRVLNSARQAELRYLRGQGKTS